MPDFTLEQALAAQRSLRDALGLGEETFPLPAFIGMISDEIEQMRQAGHGDQRVIELVRQATGQDISLDDLRRLYAPPEQRHAPPA